jgi:hypothetical protein
VNTYGWYGWKCHTYHALHDDRFFQLVKEMSVAMVSRCQDGLLGPEEFGKTVVAAAGCVMMEFLYANGERRRPLSPEEQAKEIERLAETLKK